MTDRTGRDDGAGPTEPPATGPDPVEQGAAEPGAAEPTAEPTAAEPTGLEPEEESSLETPLPEPTGEQNPRARRFRRVTRKGAIVVTARGLTGAIAVAVAVVAIGAATVVTDRAYTVDPPVSLVEPLATAQQRVCPGPLLQFGDESGGATVVSSVGEVDEVVRATEPGAESAPLDDTDDSRDVAPTLVTLPPSSASGPSSDDVALAGAQSADVSAGDLVGLTAAECSEAAGDSWLVGGATDVGRNTLVTLSNPSAVAAVVSLRIYGDEGEIIAPGTEGITVAPSTQRVFSLAGFAPDLVSPVVHVSSQGGLVVANLQQSTVRTLAPGGVDIVGTTATPSRSAVIPGFRVVDGEDVVAAQTETGFVDLESIVRIFAPGSTDTTATVTITPETDLSSSGSGDGDDGDGVGSDATADAASFEVEVTAGEVTDIPVAGLEDGRYTVRVDSEEPVVAAARVSVVADEVASDFMWLTAPSPLRETAIATVAPGPAARIHLANASGEQRDVVVTIRRDDDDEVTERQTAVTLDASGSVSLAVRAGDEVDLEGVEGVTAAVTYSGEAQAASYRISSPGAGSSDIAVYRGRPVAR
ncbi:DUF5719 family protein [Marisediminicola sp. LYQ134]|uniref:DUF5719 family protein n=1 Tax=Marisediminicola sp. LYQ134 TaxID=3391061 RepID=UPI003983534B